MRPTPEVVYGTQDPRNMSAHAVPREGRNSLQYEVLKYKVIRDLYHVLVEGIKEDSLRLVDVAFERRLITQVNRDALHHQEQHDRASSFMAKLHGSMMLDESTFDVFVAILDDEFPSLEFLSRMIRARLYEASLEEQGRHQWKGNMISSEADSAFYEEQLTTDSESFLAERDSTEGGCNLPGDIDQASGSSLLPSSRLGAISKDERENTESGTGSERERDSSDRLSITATPIQRNSFSADSIQDHFEPAAISAPTRSCDCQACMSGLSCVTVSGYPTPQPGTNEFQFGSFDDDMPTAEFVTAQPSDDGPCAIITLGVRSTSFLEERESTEGTGCNVDLPRDLDQVSGSSLRPSSRKSVLRQADLLDPLTSLEWTSSKHMHFGFIDAQAVLINKTFYMGGQSVRGNSIILCCDNDMQLLTEIESPTHWSALTTYQGKPVLVGGEEVGTRHITNKLWSLQDNGTWAEDLPPMLTRRSEATAMSTGQYLLVAGGRGVGREERAVEVFDGKMWFKTEPLPKGGQDIKSVLLNGEWYLMGGWCQGRSVFSASVNILLDTAGTCKGTHTVWRTLPKAPLAFSSPVVFNSLLLAIGGAEDKFGSSPSDAIHAFIPDTQSWLHVADLPEPLHSTSSLVLPSGDLVVVKRTSFGVHEGLLSMFKASLKVDSTDKEQLQQVEVEHKTIRILEDVCQFQTEEIERLKRDRDTAVLYRDAAQTERNTAVAKLRTQLTEIHQMKAFTAVMQREAQANMISIAEQRDSARAERDTAVAERAALVSERDALRAHLADMHQREVSTAAMGYLNGVDIISETSFEVTSQALSYEWRGYGVKLHIQQDSLPADYAQCRVRMSASLSGQYVFPTDCELVSGVYWIYCPLKLSKCATLEVQHCSRHREGLSFVRAECTQQQLPYVFQRQEGGVFSEHSFHGSIDLSRFSGWGIGWLKSLFSSQQSDSQQSKSESDSLQSDSSQSISQQSDGLLYSAQVYYSSDILNIWKVLFTIRCRRGLDLEDMVFRHRLEEATGLKVNNFGPVFPVDFTAKSIELELADPPTGWRVFCLAHPAIFQSTVDSFRAQPGGLVPHCQLRVSGTEVGSMLEECVSLKGAKKPYNFFMMICGPTIAADQHLPTATSTHHSATGNQQSPELTVFLQERPTIRTRILNNIQHDIAHEAYCQNLISKATHRNVTSPHNSFTVDERANLFMEELESSIRLDAEVFTKFVEILQLSDTGYYSALLTTITAALDTARSAITGNPFSSHITN